MTSTTEFLSFLSLSLFPSLSLSPSLFHSLPSYLSVFVSLLSYLSLLVSLFPSLSLYVSLLPSLSLFVSLSLLPSLSNTWCSVWTTTGSLRQPERELHHGRYPRKRREWQPAGVRPSDLRDPDHRGRRPEPAQGRPRGQHVVCCVVVVSCPL